MMENFELDTLDDVMAEFFFPLLSDEELDKELEKMAVWYEQEEAG